MFPIFSFYDRPNHRTIDTKNACKFTSWDTLINLRTLYEWTMRTSNNSYLQLIEFCFWISLTGLLRTISIFIKLVLNWGSPIEIVERITKSTTNSMTSEHSPGTRANKGFKDEMMNGTVILFTIPMQTNPVISTITKTRRKLFGMLSFIPVIINKRINIATFVCHIIRKSRNLFQHTTSNKTGSFISDLFKRLRCLTENPEPKLCFSVGE